MKRHLRIWVSITCLLLLFAGCQSSTGNVGLMGGYLFPSPEPLWIRNGDSIEFEGQKWYPTDEIDNILDNEVYLLGEYREVQFFIEKADVRPYKQLYTKFGRNQFRCFTLKRDS